MLLRIVDSLKSRGVTAVFTHLTHSADGNVETDAGLSSLMDAWVLLLNRETGGEFNRELYLLKARGTSHSNQVREFVMTHQGIRLNAPYVGDGRALTGSAREAEEARSRREEVRRRLEVEIAMEQIEHRRRKVKAQIDALQAELDADEAALRRTTKAEESYLDQAQSDKADMQRSRRV